MLVWAIYVKIYVCKRRVLKTFRGTGYLHSKDGVVWPWHPLVYFYIWLTISSCYGSIPLTLGLIVREDLRVHQRVLKSFPVSGASPIRPWGSLTMTSIGKFVYMAHHFILIRLNPFGLRVDREEWWFDHSMS